jgi:hypothetical protein
MVKNLADELSDILDWVENPGLGDHAREEAHAGLVIFCRGLVCGLRGGLQVTGDTPISVDEALAKAFKPDWDKAEVKRRVEEARCREERRRKSENAQIRPVDEANRLRPVDEVPCAREPFPSDLGVSSGLGSEPLRGRS